MKYTPFTQFYGLNFKEKIPVDINLKYAAVENGNFDVTVVYTTDGLNRKANLKVLEDDQNFFPEYNGALLVREGLYDELADAAPNLKDVLNSLSGTLTNEKMTDLSACLLSVALTGCGGEDTKTIRIYDGTFAESSLIHKMVELLVEEHTDAEVEILDQMAAVSNFKDLSSDNPSCELMNCYDGVLLTSYLKIDPSEVPEGISLYDYANQIAEEQYQVHLLDQIGTDNTYAIAVTQEVVDKYNPQTISDLVEIAPELRFGAEHAFFTLEGSMKYGPFCEAYGLNFKEHIAIDNSLKYSAVENGNFDVMVVYATDGLNRKAGLKVLEDDLGFFPEYNGALLVRDAIFEEFADVAPNLEEVLNMLGGQFTNEDMTDLTYAVDVEGRDLTEVAREALEARGLL